MQTSSPNSHFLDFFESIDIRLGNLIVYFCWEVNKLILYDLHFRAGFIQFVFFFLLLKRIDEYD